MALRGLLGPRRDRSVSVRREYVVPPDCLRADSDLETWVYVDGHLRGVHSWELEQDENGEETGRRTSHYESFPQPSEIAR